MIGYHYAQCRVLNLGNFTTSTDRKKHKQQIDICGYENLMFTDTEYFEKWGFKLTDYCLRTIRQRIKKLLGEEGVEPTDWAGLISEGKLRAPGRYMENGYRQYEPPQGAPLRSRILLRVEIRADLSVDKNARKNLPTLPGLNYEMINFSVPGMGADQVSKNIRMYKGNGVKTTVLGVNVEFTPEKVLLRFDQEKGQGVGKMIKVAPAESISGISITVTNRKPEANSPILHYR